MAGTRYLANIRECGALCGDNFAYGGFGGRSARRSSVTESTAMSFAPRDTGLRSRRATGPRGSP